MIKVRNDLTKKKFETNEEITKVFLNVLPNQAIYVKDIDNKEAIFITDANKETFIILDDKHIFGFDFCDMTNDDLCLMMKETIDFYEEIEYAYISFSAIDFVIRGL